MSEREKNVPAGVIKVNRIVSNIEIVLAIIASISLILMVLVITYSIFARQMGWATIWTNELASYLMLYATFLAAPWILAKDGHVRVDLVLNALRGKALKIVNIFIAVVSAAALVIFFWYGAAITWENFERGTQLASTVEWQQYILLLPIPIGSFFLVVRSLLNIFYSAPVEE